MPPAGTKEITIVTEDEKHLRVWLGTAKTRHRGHVIIFGGDSGRIEQVQPIAEWFQNLGFSTTIFDYRGFGRSTGWPTESGIYKDVRAISLLAREESPDKIAIFGLSFGACPAAYAASIIKPKLLVLASGYIDFPSVDRNNFWIPLLVDIAWPKFPTTKFIEKLTATNLLVMHGQRDPEIPVWHASRLVEHYHGLGSGEVLIAPEGTHRSTFMQLQKDLSDRLIENFQQ